jgi:hypothetical protein
MNTGIAKSAAEVPRIRNGATIIATDTSPQPDRAENPRCEPNIDPRIRSAAWRAVSLPSRIENAAIMVKNTLTALTRRSLEPR